MSPAATVLPALQRQIEANLEARPRAPVLAFQTQDPWDGPEHLELSGRSCRLAWCPSELALRERLAALEDDETTWVLLTDRTEVELAADVLARLPKGRLIQVSPWAAVLHLFGARSFDPRLAGELWMAERLLESAPAQGYRPTPTGFLDRDTAWRALSEYALGLHDGRTDLATLLRWSLEDSHLRFYLSAAQEMKEAVRKRWRETAGQTGEAIARLTETGRGTDAIPIGLACGVVFAHGWEGVPVLREAAVRLEPRLGGLRLSPGAGEAWAQSSERLLEELLGDEGEIATRLLTRGDAVLKELGAESEAFRSRWLPLGYRARLEQFAGALQQSVAGGQEPTLPEVEEAALSVQDHQYPLGKRVGGSDMALRLVRWLATSEKTDKKASFAARAVDYAGEGALVDWARTALGRSEGGAVLQPAYSKLLARTTERREAENERFAARLAGWLGGGQVDEPLVPVEDLLDKVVVPLGEQTRILLLVVDGVGLAVFQELADDLRQRGWMEKIPADAEARLLGVATLPSITEISRASLLAGCLDKGQQAHEKRCFAAHPGLTAVTGNQAPPVLFHQAELRGEHGTGLSLPVREAILSKNVRVVGAVVNAIDDHLLRGEQVVPDWTVDAIRPLGGLLEAAQEAERVVVMVADHGHVLDRGTESRPGGSGGERWRLAPPPAGKGEIELAGRRVVVEGGRIIAPWSENLRYGGARRSGYHGGATPQELLTPVAILSSRLEEPENWKGVPRSFPDWWEAVVRPEAEPQQPVARSVRARKAKDEEPQIGLFSEPEQTEGEPTQDGRSQKAEKTWLSRLLASDTLAWQREQAGPIALPDEPIRQLLDLLARHGGRMTIEALGSSLALPTFRVEERVAALQRLLNVEGYPVIERPDRETVRFDRDLLATQFGLEDSES